MTEGYYIVMSNPTPGQDEEYDRWYGEEHMPQTVEQIDGMTGGQRFRRVDVDGLSSPFPRHMVAYSFDPVDAQLVNESLLRQRQEREAALAQGRQPKLYISDAMDMTSLQSGLFVPVGARVTGPRIRD